MIYNNLVFTKPLQRPFFYTSFVATVDGKVWVNNKGYWPIGSKTDYETFTYLRAHADAVIDGKNTALRFGKNTIETINSESFKKIRSQIGKAGIPKYFVVTRHPDDSLNSALQNSFGFKPVIFAEGIEGLVQQLNKEGLDYVFIDGGPQLLASFLEKNLIDEVFLTIAPKIFGNDGSAVTMVEGKLFPKDQIKNLSLVSSKQEGDELFVRYKVKV